MNTSVQIIANGTPVPGRSHAAQVGATAALIAGAATLAVVANAAYYEDFSSTRLLVVLVALLALHLVLCPRLMFAREFAIYAAFFAYGTLTTLWTPDVFLSLNSLNPMLDFVLILVLYGSLVAYHGARAVVTGALLGFCAGAVSFTLSSGFPFGVPPGFSYNAVAAMYEFGLFLVLAYAYVSGRRLLPLLLALVMLIHIAATTSIKMNLGVALGFLCAVLLHARDFARTVRRIALPLLIMGAGLTYAVLSNPEFVARLQYGSKRLQVGLEVLQAREDVTGYSGFNERVEWARDSLSVIAGNPVFGAGAEAFRFRVGITSHSTPVDIAYNFGLIGLVLFYGMFALLFMRLMAPQLRNESLLRGLVLAQAVCGAFVTLSGTFFYNAFLAAAVGISVALLRTAVATRAPPSNGKV